MKMTRIISFAAVAAMVIAAVGCSGDKKGAGNTVTLEEAEAQFASELQNADTTQVLDMGAAFMESLKEGNVDQALDMLYTREMSDTTGTTLRKLNDKELMALKQRFELMPVLSYEIDHYDFSIPSLNDLKYKYVFNPDSPMGTQKIMFNPIKRDGRWYLMLKQHDQPAKDAKNALDPSAAIAMPE